MAFGAWAPSAPKRALAASHAADTAEPPPASLVGRVVYAATERAATEVLALRLVEFRWCGLRLAAYDRPDPELAVALAFGPWWLTIHDGWVRMM
jgi:hypothetical protein